MDKRARIEATLQGEVVDRPAVSFWRHFYKEETSAKGLADAMLGFQKKYDWDFMKVNPVIVLIATATKDEAESIGKQLVEKKLAACTNIIPNIRSLFIWDKQFCEEDEVLLIVKSIHGKVGEIVTIVKELHSYDVPEIIAIPIIDGSKDYLDWLQESIT